MDAAGNIAGGTLEAQGTQVFENLKVCLAAVGATFENLLKLTTYIVNYKPEARPVLAAARVPYMPKDPPASTLLGVQALAAPEYLIEVEATAYLP